MYDIFWFTENSQDLPNIKLTTVCEWMGLDTSQAHNSLYDVKNTATLIVKFMRLRRYLYPKIQFANSCKQVDNDKQLSN